MILARYVLLSLLLLPIAEIVAFVAVASAIGVWRAVLLALFTSLVGLIILRGEGIARLVRAGRDRRSSRLELHAANFVVLLGGTLLLLPGFISDAVGVVLLLAPRTISRAVLRRIFKPRRPAQRPGVVDLEPDQWRDVPEERLEDRRRDRDRK